MAPAKEERKSYKIGDVCKVADVQPYVLRYWETEFPPLAPDKTGGGQRTYSQRDVDIILRIKELLYSEGFTIAGAKKKLEVELKSGRKPAPPSAPAAGGGSGLDEGRREIVKTVRAELSGILDLLQEKKR